MKFRANHGVPNVEQTPALCEHADAYAAKLASEGTFGHDSNELGKYEEGENLYSRVPEMLTTSEYILRARRLQVSGGALVRHFMEIDV